MVQGRFPTSLDAMDITGILGTVGILVGIVVAVLIAIVPSLVDR